MFLIILPILIVLGGIFYYFSVQSRKRYRCPECGEQLQVEHMEATNCNLCGTPLVREN
ncbi:MAG: ribosomal protein S27AE [Verrucomicrobiales bacterium]|jgi:ribosomal protein S27AE